MRRRPPRKACERGGRAQRLHRAAHQEAERGRGLQSAAGQGKVTLESFGERMHHPFHLFLHHNQMIKTNQTHLIFFKTFTRTNLRSDLRVKENSLRIDRGKCMGQRLRFPYNQAQQLNKQTKYFFEN